jgi:uncharacterized protein (TIGR03435 family)
MHTVTLIVVLVALVTALAGAQSPKTAFEVASVRLNMSREPGRDGPTTTRRYSPNGFSAVNVTLRQLIGIAQGLEFSTVTIFPDRLVGGPSWVQTQRFDITARAGTEVSQAQVNAMLQTLLEDRFKLVVATEQRQRDAYVLKLARVDGRLGPDLRKAAADCEVTRRKDPLALRTPLPSNGGLMSAGYTCTTIDSVAGAVELTLNAAVINETGLTGRWDYVISHNGLESGMKPARGGTPMEYPSIFKAVEEQLGLKLERRREKASYDVLVIKSVELPSEN